MTPSLRTPIILAPLEVGRHGRPPMQTSRIRFLTGLVGLLWSAFILFTPPAVNAGVILQAPTYVGLNSGLVGYWSFNGPDIAGVTAYDRSGQGNNGTSTAGQNPARVAGKLGQALAFDGTNDYVQILNGSTISPYNQSRTISAWFMARTMGTQDAILSTGRNIAESTPIWQVLKRSTNQLSVFHNNNYWNGSTVLKAGVWYLATYTFDSSTNVIKLYLNGDTELSTTAADSPDQNSSVFIGGGWDPVNNAFPGSIDEVRIYNRALSPDEVKRLYKIGSTFTINATRKDTLRDGLVGHWSFDQPDMAGVVAYDRSGQGNNGTLTNGPTRAIGKIGQALSFDGNDSVDIDNSPNLGEGGAITLSAWIKLDPNVPADGKKYIISKRASGGAQWRFYHDPQNGSVLGFGVTNASDVTVETTSTGPFPADTAWHHVLAKYDGVLVYVYGDGNLLGTAAQTGAIKDLANDICIGASWTGDACSNVGIEEFPGLIDEVRIYNRALSPDEIKRLYNMGGTYKINASRKDVLTDGLVGYWSFDGKDMAGNTAYDRSGHGNNGFLITNEDGTPGGAGRAAGKIGQGLDFNAAEFDAVRVAEKPEFEGTQISASTWIRVNPGVTNQIRIITKHRSGFSQWLLYRASLALGSKLIFSVTNTADVAANAQSSGAFANDNAWHHVVGTYDGATVKVYGDGQLLGSAALTGAIKDQPLDVCIGASEPNAFCDGGAATFDGLMDEVRIYNRALTPDEIKRLYNMGR